MAKSKLIKANQKIADVVVSGYKTIENGVVKTYTKLEDRFVDRYLTKDGETVEEAKKRLKEEEKRRRKEQEERIRKYSKSTEEIQKEIKEKYGR